MHTSSREKSWLSSALLWVCKRFSTRKDPINTSSSIETLYNCHRRSGTGIVIERSRYALKIPRILRHIEVDGLSVTTGRLTFKEGDYDERPDLIRSIQDEKAIYRRLGDHLGIVRCFNLASDDPLIQMDLMTNGDLRHYLTDKKPEKSTQLCNYLGLHQWRTPCHTSMDFSDFGESAMMPPDWDLNGSDDLGFSIMTDIGQFGAVMFEIVTGQKYKFNLAHTRGTPGGSYTWPQRTVFLQLPTRG
ncbi:hypothetical protein AJ79_04403 [Helicocarpus griseus UAMH5409]|uniref:Protein kinase domain-containing protein n=1 Tax=Helicocarpus griseus UAMH5409 TaxID=1447875 RepID=A0A2B7XTX5_9EURO|nr:hypothetical protein AJ79_04403 [Helicocarpus griseus UAMH5409]